MGFRSHSYANECNQHLGQAFALLEDAYREYIAGE